MVKKSDREAVFGKPIICLKCNKKDMYVTGGSFKLSTKDKTDRYHCFNCGSEIEIVRYMKITNSKGERV